MPQHRDGLFFSRIASRRAEKKSDGLVFCIPQEHVFDEPFCARGDHPEASQAPNYARNPGGGLLCPAYNNPVRMMAL
jgi:hypothetical protein